MTNPLEINKQAEVSVPDGLLLVKAKKSEKILKKTITREKYIQGHKDYATYLEELQLVRLKMEEASMVTIQNEFVWRAKGVEAVSKAIADAKIHSPDVTGISFNLAFGDNPDVKRYCTKELFTAPMRFAVIGYDIAPFARAKNLDPKDSKTIDAMFKNFQATFDEFVNSLTKSENFGSVYIAGNEQYGHIWIEFAHSNSFIEIASQYGYHEFAPKEK